MLYSSFLAILSGFQMHQMHPELTCKGITDTDINAAVKEGKLLAIQLAECLQMLLPSILETDTIPPLQYELTDHQAQLEVAEDDDEESNEVMDDEVEMVSEEDADDSPTGDDSSSYIPPQPVSLDYSIWGLEFYQEMHNQMLMLPKLPHNQVYILTKKLY